MSIRNCTTLLLSVSALLFLFACGGSNSPHTTPPPTGGFANTDLNGTYTFSVSGVNGNGLFAMAGSLVACGCSGGTISGGTADFEDPTGVLPGASIGNNSTYSITSDGRGFARLFINGLSNEIDMDFVLTSNSHGMIIRFDGSGTGSGTIDSQSTAVTLNTTPYAFSLFGADFANNPLGTVGAFTLDNTGTMNASASVQDFNFAGTPSAQLGLSGSVTLGSGTAPGSATVSSSFGTFGFDVYTVSNDHLKLIENDGQAILVGDVFSAPSSSIPTGNLVFTMSGIDLNGALFAVGGLMSSNGSALSGTEDVNDAGLVDNGTTTPFTFSGPFVDTGNGRLQATLSGFVGGSVFVAYPSSGGLLTLEMDAGLNAGITAGTALAQQSGATIEASQGYGMNLSGEDVVNAIELDEIAEFKTSSSTFDNGIVDVNDGGPANPHTLTGNYTMNANGTGSATLTFGLQSMFMYAADTSTILFISTDPNQAALGTMEVQSGSQATPGATLRARSMPMQRALPHVSLAKHPSHPQFGRK